MTRRPTLRRSFREQASELNLTPMMNLIGILIPVLLVATAFVELAVMDAVAPGHVPGLPPDLAPMRVQVAITSAGYQVGVSGTVPDAVRKVMPSDSANIAIPITQRAVSCAPYLGTRPPPRDKNHDLPACASAGDQATYWTYDTTRLQALLAAIKDGAPEEREIVITAEADVHYEAVTDVMDVSRRQATLSGGRPLFDQVLIDPTSPME